MPHDYGGVQVSAVKFALFTLAWCAPWSFLLPQVAAFSYRKASAEQNPGARHTANAVLLLILGAAAPLTFFLLTPARLVYYGLPALPPLLVLCAGFLGTSEHLNGWNRLLAAGMLVAAGLVLTGATFFLPAWLAGIPDLAATPLLLRDIPIEMTLLAAGFVFCGLLFFLSHEQVAFAGLVVLMGALEIPSISEFHALDPIFSSRKLVEKIAGAAGPDCVWVSEGSSEVGASAGMTFYLRQRFPDNPKYVLIMDDDLIRRPPPSYPGKPPSYLIDHQRLEELWSSGSAVLFVTDFQRTDWENDKLSLPARDCRQVPLTGGGHRQVYANSPAWNRLAAAGLIPAVAASASAMSK